jgi:hypothetical protein
LELRVLKDVKAWLGYRVLLVLRGLPELRELLVPRELSGLKALKVARVFRVLLVLREL